MNIEIDIRVSGDNGEEIQTVSRHFSGDFSDSLDWGKGVDKTGRSFDSFLNEFLTSSGRIFRQALLYGYQRKREKENKKFKEKGRNEVTYMIQFGNGQKVTGSIPICKTIYPQQASCCSHDEIENRMENRVDKNSRETSTEEFISYFMQKAVERYESNFVHIGKSGRRDLSKHQDSLTD